MNKYAILCHPQSTKIYKEDTEKILVNETKSILNWLDINTDNMSYENIAGAWYIVFEADKQPSNAALKEIARLSYFYVAFEVKGDMFMPMQISPDYVFLEDMPALLNYQGKTNASFTRLMVNLAKSACTTNTVGRKGLLDPVAGKGTTLYDALMLGDNAYGIELSPKYYDESCHYATKFMQKAKFKHLTKKDKVLDPKARKISDAYTLEFAADKKSFAAKDTGIFKVYCADTRIANRLIKKKSIDMIVGDLPYGIQHANKKTPKKGEISRSADGLFADAFYAWHALLKEGGAVVFSFNEHTTSKDKLAEIISKNGMKVIDEDDYHHRVDSSIKRNLIVAVKL